MPPILAVEVAGTDDDEERLRVKASWYSRHGVKVVWIVLPERREVVALLPDGEQRFSGDERIAETAELRGCA